MARHSKAALRFHVREAEIPAPERVQRGLALWGEYLLRHLTSPEASDEPTDHLTGVR